MCDEFPWLSVDDYYYFPSPLETDDDVVGVGGNLSPGMLLSAYSQGIFPWYEEDSDILWWSLNERLILFPDKLKVSGSMKKLIKKGAYRISLDRDFRNVISGCSSITRSHEKGTWIHPEMIEAYCSLHKEGYAHSVEVWKDEELVGGLYGVAIGSCFAGESMFARESNTSKLGFIALVLFLKEQGFDLIDCQQETSHLKSLGAEVVSKEVYYKYLTECMQKRSLRGNWSELFPSFPESHEFLSIRQNNVS